MRKRDKSIIRVKMKLNIASTVLKTLINNK